MRDELKKNWRWYLALLLIFASNILGSAEAYHNSKAACERGNPLRSVVHQSVKAAKNANGKEAKSFKRQLDRLNETPTINGQGEVDCSVVVSKPWYLP